MKIFKLFLSEGIFSFFLNLTVTCGCMTMYDKNGMSYHFCHTFVSMSKQTSTTVKGSKGNNPTQALAHLAKVAADQAAKINKHTNILVAIALIGAAIWTMLMRDIAGASTAMLYLLANNGKLSGRADGNVYMRNGHMRGFIVPRLVQNGYTTLQRTLFAQMSSAWSTLSQSDQDSWNNVANVFKSNRFGQSIPVSGKQLFIMRNVNLIMIGSAPISTYISAERVNGVTGIDPSGATTAGVITALSLAFNPSPD